jgi:GT2 family glycosyltransferase
LVDLEKPLVSIVIPTKDRFDKLERLVQQLKTDGYENKEIIIVDDNSQQAARFTSSIFDGVVIIKSSSSTPSLARNRNLGTKHSKGQYIFFIDDDNSIDTDTVENLVSFLDSNKKIGVTGPLMYHFDKPDTIWCAGIRRSFYTSRTKYIGADQKNRGDLTNSHSEEFPNAFMVRREVIGRVGPFREDLFPFHYGEADFCKRALLAGYEVALVPSAKIWHDFKGSDMTGKTRVSKNRAYYYGRNRVLFHRMYSTAAQLAAFFFFEYALIIPAYMLLMLRSGKSFQEKIGLARTYLAGVHDGIFYSKEKLVKKQQ